MKIIKKNLLITLALLMINGCSELLNNKEHKHFISQVSLKHFKLNKTITQDMIHFIKNYYLIPKTTFYFQLGSSVYAHDAIIEEGLRSVGYGVSYIRKRGTIPFAYKIDFIDNNIMRTTYNIGSATLSRLYSIEGNQATPISAFTARGFKKRIYQNYPNSSYSLKKAIVSIPVLNVRNSPSLKGKIIGKFYKDSLIYVEEPIINSGKKWSRVILTNLHNKEISSNIEDRYVATRYIQYIK